ncbi:methylmalonate-semialdehyde dehydrogenase [Legionella quinlivanii]|uniref:methylmalonate-semialdehyde dehydrogenase (CoA acylating) n=1 Tax=Legionella quinlivanii TaxID=45073 RepID=A0A0W0XKN6_9GAMM|nr:CoA-acylating methylmalonate-semialdehyde dehydrogenase [Legionella quinlivanii]KTD45126.1 methylmalonate-semialdehyde dehydrogenase [Legionella quinlivanii]SEG49703.1 methylmalonate-semialdehyde dehydrogenase [acylating] [Legionella quinlivanii DSM 21216]STY09728.1 methylmalonate-semialdehyde dehydrogenase [Legionella quinlivanii]
MDTSIGHFINGKITINDSKNTQQVYNPALGEIIAEVHFADEQVCEQAISAAEKAGSAWAETPPLKRARVFFKFRELLEKNQNELAAIVNREHGKTIDDAKGSIARAIEVVEFHCGLVSHLQGQFSAEVSSGIDSHTLYQPLGICAGVSPFNFPVMVPVWMMIPAIACGNTFLLKPSEQDPSAPLRLLELLDDAGLPPGVANCIQGNKDTVDYLLRHPKIKAFTAVASTPVAEYIYTEACAHGKRAHTFGGAKNHCVIMPDADFAQAAQAVTGAAYGSAGERCMAISAVVAVGDETADRFINEINPLIRAIKVDAGDAAGCDMGPLISKAHKERVVEAISNGVEEGARLLIDGRSFTHPEHPQGFFVGPTLFDHVTESMSIYQKEIFGPVLIVLRVNSFDEALALVNRNQYGNGTAIFTRDGYTARRYSQEVQVGMVGVNIPIPVPIVNHPFGGWKHSSFGNTNMHALESIHFYTHRKTVTSKWPLTNLKQNAFVMPTHD